MATKIKLKTLFADNIKKLKSVEKNNPELNIYSVLFELSCCHTMSIDEIHKVMAKITNRYMDFNEFRVTEIDDICSDLNMPERIDDLLPFIQCLDDVFEKNGTVDLSEISKYDETKISALFSRLSGNINGSCYSYYLNRLGKEGPYVFSDNQVRILKRLKIVDETDEFDSIKKKVEKAYPGEKGVSFFLACQVFANEYCREDNPSCTRCPFIEECEFGKNIVKEREEKEKERELVRQRALEEEQRKIDSEKKKVKASKKKDKNEEVDVEPFDENAEPVLTKKEKKKLQAEQDAIAKAALAQEKAAAKVESKLKKTKGTIEATSAGVEETSGIPSKKKGAKGQISTSTEAPVMVESKKLTAKEKKLLEKSENIPISQSIGKKGELKTTKKLKEELVVDKKQAILQAPIKVDKKGKKQASTPIVEEIKSTKGGKKGISEQISAKLENKSASKVVIEDKKNGKKGKVIETAPEVKAGKVNKINEKSGKSLPPKVPNKKDLKKENKLNKPAKKTSPKDVKKIKVKAKVIVAKKVKPAKAKKEVAKKPVAKKVNTKKKK